MPSLFENKKLKILEQLAVPDSTYHDASPKGSVDERIRALVDEINVLDTLVTTSSCAGRIAVYLEGKKKSRSTTVDASAEEANAGAGGKGGGQWLFVSHDPLETPSQRLPTELTCMFGMSSGAAISIPASTQDVRWVRCKFEPMVGDAEFVFLPSFCALAWYAISNALVDIMIDTACFMFLNRQCATRSKRCS